MVSFATTVTTEVASARTRDGEEQTRDRGKALP